MSKLRAGGLTHDQAAELVGAVFRQLAEQLRDEGHVTLKHFGRLEVRDKGARAIRHPQTGATLDLPRRRVVVFRGAGRLRARMSTSLAPQEQTDE